MELDNLFWSSDLIGKRIWLDQLAPERLTRDSSPNCWLYAGIGENDDSSLAIGIFGDSYVITDILVKLPE